MTTSTALVVAGAFLGSAVERVEAVTIVIGVGVVRGWRSPLIGAGAAVLVLAALVVALGPALTVIPIHVLRLIVGALLLAFGLQWLRKAILRAGGAMAQRDEGVAFLREQEEAAAAGTEDGAGVDWPGDVLSLPVLIGFIGLVSFVLVQALRRRPAPLPSGAGA